MAVKIRLSRVGKKNAPFYRVVVVDSRAKRDGMCLDNIGTYDVLRSAIVRFDEDQYLAWIAKGAQPTDSTVKLYKKYKKGGVAQKKTNEVTINEEMQVSSESNA